MLFQSTALSADTVVGVIIPGDSPYYVQVHAAFQEKLHRETHAQVLVQRPYPDPISLSNAARKLIATDVDVIVAYGTAATAAVLQERPSMPVVYAAVYEPLAAGLKYRDLTGISANVPVSSLIRYLRSITPVKTLGVVYNPNEQDSNRQYQEIMHIASQYGFAVEPMNAARSKNAAAIYSAKQIDAFVVTGTGLTGTVFPGIRDLARERRIPIASLFGVKTSESIVTLSASPIEQGEHAAEKVARILDGTPADRIRRETSKETELIFNLKESIAIGCRIPMELVTEATTLIK